MLTAAKASVDALKGHVAMKANEFKLYQSRGSPNSRRVRIFLAEKSICMPMVPVDLGAKEQFSEACRDAALAIRRDGAIRRPRQAGAFRSLGSS